MTTTGAMTAAALVARLRAHYLPPPKPAAGLPITAEQLLPGAVLLTEVPSPAGRRIDALVVNLTRSRQGLDGFEIKVSRSDWLAELDAPEKADPWFAATHRWWIAAPSTDVVRPEELPAGWGLMVPSPRSAARMKIVTRADTRTPELGWLELWEIVKKLDRMRAGECAATAEQVRLQLAEQAREQLERIRESATAVSGDAAAAGSALSAVTGLPDWRLRHALEKPSPWLSEALRAVFAVDQLRTGGATEEVVRHVRRVAEQHEQALTALNRALVALAPPTRDEEGEVGT
ncbi:hypothetical protein [Amycolatopsis sp. cg9]|uniref:hypothetical protein n=1 Tax=Amycolatopsis sp. cg9 TaxID=3238801 RepID=UPI003523B1A2